MEDLTDPSGPGTDIFWKIYKIPLILGAGSLILIVASVYLLVKSQANTTPIKFESEQASPSGRLAKLITVDVEGAVNKPGVYQLPPDSRAEDAIDAAGGLSAQADQEKISASINLAQKISDGAKLYIPKIGDTSVLPAQTYSSNASDNLNQLVNINTATSSLLDQLSGVGPVIAKKIIDSRPYLSLEELVSKKVMSQSLFTKLKPQLTL